MENIIMHILVQFLFFGYILGKNHFDADVLNNRFKVRRLVKFKLDLCQKIYDVKHSNSDNVEINALNNYARKIMVDICFDDDRNLDDKDVIEYTASSPIRQYKLMKDFRKFAGEIYPKALFEYLDSGNQGIIYSTVAKHLENKLEFPWEDDVSAASFSLLLLPFTYDFHPISMVDGKLGINPDAKIKLTYDDVIYIVDVCLNSTHSILESGIFGPPYQPPEYLETKHYAIAIEWLEAAEILVKRNVEGSNQNEDETIWTKRLKDVHNQILGLKQMHDQNYGSYKIQNHTDSLPSPEDFFIRKFNDDTEISSILMRKEEKRIVENLFASPIEHKSGNVHQFKINEYLTLCRGKLLKFQNSSTQRQEGFAGKCYLTHQQEPYFYLSPLKLEVIMENTASIYLYHSILSEVQVNAITDYTELMDVDEPETGSGWKGPWKYKDMLLEDHYSLEVFKVSHLLDKITGLQVTSPDMKGREADIPISLKEASTLNPASEDLRINTYAAAGFIYPHYDSVDSESILNDQYVAPGQHRIATAMLYLSTVEGGATIFPNLGISVFPTQGSLLFWYNTYSDGNRNDFTLHASCPVLEGVKIIGNKWIHYQEQTFKKPCKSKDRKFILNNNSPKT